mmetsp:Transcript_555/g.972  ORF Transcript_555/g.972 Transcript_555/m.972 type:complete len:406 (-) Transcript_555:180-1397(-)
MYYCKLSCIFFLFLSSATGFQSTSSSTRRSATSSRTFDLFKLPRQTSSVSKTILYNVPPPSIDGDPNAIKDTADRESPPQSFFQLQLNCARAAELAIRDGHRLIEVEFPPLPAQVLEMDDVSAYDVAEANFKLALDFAKSFAAKQSSSEGDKSKSDETAASTTKIPKNVAILFPDESEMGIALERTSLSTNPYPGVTVSSLRCSDPRDTRFFKPEQTFMSLFGGKSGGIIQPIPGVEMYIVIVASAQELPDVEELSELDPNAIICLYNLKLDVLRGDLGAPAFPPKEFQDRFLSRVKPVYYLRTRQYSRSTATPPYLVNYQGCLFRSYPGEFQTLLDTGTGSYRRVQGNKVRPALGEFKEQLTKALQVEGIIQEESGFLNFLRTGYKTTTWWEEDRENASDAWRT